MTAPAKKSESAPTSARVGRAEGESDSIVHVGEVINGKYRIDRMLGSGGMADVVEAFHFGLEERVALKFLKREAMTNKEIVQRFEMEAKAASKLKSEHVGRVTDVDARADGVPFIVMEYLEGNDLELTLQEVGAFKIEEAVEYAIQACEGLAEAHARGIVHRDIKPANIFLVTRSDGWKSVKILDFGISKAALGSVSQSQLATQNSNQIMGSPYYMSPEQLRGQKDVDARSDLWSLGCVLFELLTGKTAFEECDDIRALFPKILTEQNRQLLAFRTDAPPGLQDVVNKCLEKERGKRYPNAAELAIALLPFAPKRARVTAERAVSLAKAAGHEVAQIQSIPPPPSGTVQVLDRASGQMMMVNAEELSALTASAKLDSSRVTQKEQKKSPVLFIAIAVVLIVGIGGYLATRKSPEQAGTPDIEKKPVAAKTNETATSEPKATADIKPSADATTSVANAAGASATTKTIAPVQTQPRIRPTGHPTGSAPKPTSEEIRLTR